jgi:hypothetical protein
VNSPASVGFPCGLSNLFDEARVCERSFGPLPERLRVRVDAADPDMLALWTERAMFCQTVEAVFEPLEN